MAVYLGLMSGTSLDGVDAAAVRFDGEGERPEAARLLAFRSLPYEPPFRARLERATREAGPAEVCALDAELGRRLGDAAAGLLEEAGLASGSVSAIGSHGQTLWHAPPSPEGPSGEGGCTLQIGRAAEIAERTGVRVVSDFRAADVAAGGQGAPLTPYFDRLMLASRGRARFVLNLGGMANVTALPPEGSGAEPVAFDTGPGVALVDAAVRRLADRPFDRDGRLAAAGVVREAALAPWLEDPFFDREPPRSTGRERFGADRVEAWLAEHEALSAEDLVATLTELTARTAAGAIGRVAFGPDEVVLCGGGARNPELVRRIRERLSPAAVRDLSELGWDPEAREAVAFALLARQHLLGHPASAPWATGARGRRVLGSATPPAGDARRRERSR